MRFLFVTVPKRAKTKEPLSAWFPEPLDRWLLERYLRVIDPDGRPVDGQIRVGAEERRWTFLPDDRWRTGTYTLDAHKYLEDLGGNTPERIFDTDLTAPKPPPVRSSLPFHIDPSGLDR